MSCSGIGLHSGQKVTLSLKPARAGTGIRFRRADLGGVEIPATVDNVDRLHYATGLARDAGTVETVEHLLAALVSLGVDNVIVVLNQAEVPIMDGSSAPFVFLLQSAGVHEQEAPKRFLRIRQPVQVSDGDKWARFEPHDGYRLSFAIEFAHPALRRSGQQVTLDFSTTTYIKEVARARTFGFMRELDALRANNLGLGASLDNVVALDDFRVVNPDGLRYDDEFVRHKILDAVGDLYLLGHSVIGAYSAYKSGHALNNKLVRAVLEDPAAWEVVTFTGDNAPAPITYGRGSLAAA